MYDIDVYSFATDPRGAHPMQELTCPRSSASARPARYSLGAMSRCDEGGIQMTSNHHSQGRLQADCATGLALMKQPSDGVNATHLPGGRDRW